MKGGKKNKAEKAGRRKKQAGEVHNEQRVLTSAERCGLMARQGARGLQREAVGARNNLPLPLAGRAPRSASVFKDIFSIRS